METRGQLGQGRASGRTGDEGDLARAVLSRAERGADRGASRGVGDRLRLDVAGLASVKICRGHSCAVVGGA